MKRSDVTAIFPDASDEQIKKLMDLNGADINTAKASADEIKKQLDAANTELEAAKKAAAAAVSADELKKATDRAAALETELNGLKASNALRDKRFAVAKEKGIPPELLTGETEDDMKAQADAILAFAKPSYPTLPDGGEASHVKGGSTRDQFAAWAEKAF